MYFLYVCWLGCWPSECSAGPGACAPSHWWRGSCCVEWTISWSGRVWTAVQSRSGKRLLPLCCLTSYPSHPPVLLLTGMKTQAGKRERDMKKMESDTNGAVGFGQQHHLSAEWAKHPQGKAFKMKEMSFPLALLKHQSEKMQYSQIKEIIHWEWT